MSVEPTSLERSWNGLGLPLPAALLKALHLRCVRFSSWVQGQNNTTSKCLSYNSCCLYATLHFRFTNYASSHRDLAEQVL